MKPATSDDVLELIDAALTSTSLGAALELGLFWLFERQPLTVEAIGKELDIPANRCRYWLQLLERNGLLEESGGLYSPSPTARAAILEAYSRDTWALLAEEVRKDLPSLRDLPLHIRTKGSAWQVLGFEPTHYVQQMKEDPAWARRFTRMLMELHGPLSEILAEILDMTGVERFMDLGGGSGVLSHALLRRHPRPVGVLVDLALVCDISREIAAEMKLEDRLTFHPVDFLRDELPRGFDMILELDVNIYDEVLLSKIRESLKPGGRFVIIDQFAPSEGIPHPTRIHWAFDASMGNPDFEYLSYGQVKARLERAGFEILSERGLPPVPGAATRFTQEMGLLEARRG